MIWIGQQIVSDKKLAFSLFCLGVLTAMSIFLPGLLSPNFPLWASLLNAARISLLTAAGAGVTAMLSGLLAALIFARLRANPSFLAPLTTIPQVLLITLIAARYPDYTPQAQILIFALTAWPWTAEPLLQRLLDQQIADRRQIALLNGHHHIYVFFTLRLPRLVPPLLEQCFSQARVVLLTDIFLAVLGISVPLGLSQWFPCQADLRSCSLSAFPVLIILIASLIPLRYAEDSCKKLAHADPYAPFTEN